MMLPKFKTIWKEGDSKWGGVPNRHHAEARLILEHQGAQTGCQEDHQEAEQLHFLFWKSPALVKMQVGTVSLLPPLQKSLN